MKMKLLDCEKQILYPCQDTFGRHTGESRYPETYLA